jgi:thiol:disulfide interchange protein DsbA
MVEESAADTDDAQTGDVPLMLAQAETSTSPANWKFKEGQHFHRLVPTQPTVGGADKVEVAEFFWYGCAHCYEFETYINRWAEQTPPNVRFVRIPATWNPLVKLHAQLYYTEEVLVANDKIADPDGFRAAVFAEYHRRGNRLTSESSIRELFARHGVSEDDFNNTWESFEVAQKLRVAQDLARRYAISGVPAMVVNGKYRSGKAETGTYPKLLEVVDELVAREER